VKYYKLPLVTIITGYYNRVGYVEKSIQSLLNQDYPNIEIIVFDDCSTDGTYEKLSSYYGNNYKINIIRHDENIGFVKGLVKAIELSSGEYIAIHGSGDISHHERISKQIEFLNKNKNYSIVGCRRVYKGECLNKYYGDVIYDQIVKKNYFSHGEVMFRKLDYNKVGGYDQFFKFAQDRDLWLRLLKVKKGYILKDFLYQKNNPKNSVSRTPQKKIKQKIFSYWAVYKSINDVKSNNGMASFKNFDLSIWLLRYGLRHVYFPAIVESIKRFSLKKV
jgi:glycosyltransferase involved in cell wall biosynthesis